MIHFQFFSVFLMGFPRKKTVEFLDKPKSGIMNDHEL